MFMLNIIIFFSCRIMCIKTTINMMLMVPLCSSLLKSSHEALPPAVSMDMLKLSTRRLVTSIEFDKAPY